MKQIILFFLCLLSTTIVSAKIKIVHGQDVTLQMYPWQVFVKSDNSCGGSIINSRFILTAAHCVDYYQPFEVKILGGGSGARTELKELSKVKAIYVHPDYSDWGDGIKRADIALVELESDIEFSDTLRPIHLPESNLLVGFNHPTNFQKDIAVTGWGYNADDLVSGQLQMIDHLTLLPASKSIFWNSRKNSRQVKKTDFRASINLLETYLTGEYIAVATSEQKTMCYGDSGGPMSEFRNNRHILVGLASHVSHTDCKNVKVFYYTNVFVFLDWIKKMAKL